MKNIDKNDMPIYLIFLSLVFVFPLGIYYIVLKTKNNLNNIKQISVILKHVGYLAIIIGIIYFLAEYPEYVSLIDSHMNLDMYSFNFVYVYIYIIMIIVSSLIGAYLLNRICDKLKIYTEFINIRHIKDIKLICEETGETLEETKKNIVNLIDKGYLINIKINKSSLVSTKTVDKRNLVKCKSCGNIEKLYKKKIKCSFCMRELGKKDCM